MLVVDFLGELMLLIRTRLAVVAEHGAGVFVEYHYASRPLGKNVKVYPVRSPNSMSAIQMVSPW